MLPLEDVVNDQKIFAVLRETANPAPEAVLAVLAKASEKKGLTAAEIGCLINATDPALVAEMFATARRIKWEIYGERLVFFAPLYVSSFCVNDCAYCGFRRGNAAPRKKLSLIEVAEQVKILEDMGHKRLLLEFGEDPDQSAIDFAVAVIKTIYETRSGRGAIRRINVNLAATTVDNYKKLKSAGIGTYQLFQETYHRDTFVRLHDGPKQDYARQLFAHDRAYAAGIDDVGLGVLFGLYDWRFEVLALVAHADYLEKKFGIGPHTISVPRWQRAAGVNWLCAPYAVSDDELLKIIAILRMAVPYTGMIISTRESPEIRAKAFAIGISQTSAASRTAPGGYGKIDRSEQFALADHRSLEEILLGILSQELLPSFCTACYRSGRTGHDFMPFAKSGEIQNLCRPNAILTFQEYLEDYASDNVKQVGRKVLNKYLLKITEPNIKKETMARLMRISRGERDLYF